MSRPSIITLVGESGTGKSTLMSSLVVESGLFRILTSATTRAPRSSDLRHEYRYLSDEEYGKIASNPKRFLWDVPAGNFGDRYAKDTLDVEEAFTDNEHVYINALIPSAAAALVRLYGSELIKTVYLESPGTDELRTRMLQRGDDPEKVEERLVIEKDEDWPDQLISLEGLVIITSQNLLVRQDAIHALVEFTDSLSE